jgi:hypothetical protein
MLVNGFFRDAKLTAYIIHRNRSYTQPHKKTFGLVYYPFSYVHKLYLAPQNYGNFKRVKSFC